MWMLPWPQIRCHRALSLTIMDLRRELLALGVPDAVVQRACRLRTGSRPPASASQRLHSRSWCTAPLVRNSRATRSIPSASLQALPGARSAS